MEMTNNLTYTANNQDGQTWLVADNPYELVSQPKEYWQFSRDKFYHHWRYHKACGETDLTWFEWIKKFDKVII